MWNLRKNPIVNGGMNWLPMLTYAYVGKIMGWSPARSLGSHPPPAFPIFLCHAHNSWLPSTQSTLQDIPSFCWDGTPCRWRFGSHGPSHHPKLSAQHRSKSPFHTSSCWFPSQVIWSLVPYVKLPGICLLKSCFGRWDQWNPFRPSG